jgi:hypothetical protein
MDDKYRGMPETDWLMMELDAQRMRSSIERVGDDILVCDDLEEDEISDGLKFTHEQEDPIGTETKEKTMRELMNEELDVSKEMELLEKWYKKHKKK